MTIGWRRRGNRGAGRTLPPAVAMQLASRRVARALAKIVVNNPPDMTSGPEKSDRAQRPPRDPTDGLRRGPFMHFLNARHVLASAVITLAFTASVAPAAVRDFAYVSPVPGSHMVSPENNVALRLGVPLDAASVSTGLGRVTGALSGPHAGRSRLS